MFADMFVVLSMIALFSSPLFLKLLRRKTWMLVNTGILGVFLLSWFLILSGMNAFWLTVFWNGSLIVLLMFFFVSFTLYIDQMAAFPFTSQLHYGVCFYCEPQLADVERCNDRAFAGYVSDCNGSCLFNQWLHDSAHFL